MRLLATIAFTLVFNLAWGQELNNEPLLNSFIKALRGKGIDTILVYENGIIGNNIRLVEAGDTCVYTDREKTYTVFWKAKGLDLVSRLSNTACYEYNIISYDAGTIWDFYFKNKKNIRKERLLEPSYKDKGHTYSLVRDHYAYSGIMVMVHEDSVEYKVIEYYFPEMIDGDKRNINYTRNINSSQKKLQVLVDEAVKKIEGASLIKKIFK